MFMFRSPPRIKASRSGHELIIARLAPHAQRAFLDAAKKAQERVDVGALELALESRRDSQAVRALDLDSFTAFDLARVKQTIAEAYLAGRIGTVAKGKKEQVQIDDRKITVTLSELDRRNGYRIVDVDTSKFDSMFAQSKDFYIGPGGKNGIGQRYARVGEFLSRASTMDASAVAVNTDGSVSFVDGRHRYAFLRDKGVTSIPVAMSRESEAAAGKLNILANQQGPVSLDFKTTNPKALAAAQRQAADLLTAVNVETKQTVRDLIARAYREQITSRDTARMIRDVVGLNDRQATALFNYRAGLVEDGRAADQVERMTARYGDRLLRQRADTIAQTEIHRASAEGQHELWREGVREGRIGANARRIWIANTGACEWCEAIESINADGVPIDGQFETPDGDMIDGPEESHINCRCSSGLETE